MEEPKNAKLFLALKSRYALHNTDRLVEFILDDQKTSFDFITEIIPQIEEENKKAPKLFKVTVDTDILERLRAKQTCKGKYPLNDANIANEVRLIILTLYQYDIEEFHVGKIQKKLADMWKRMFGTQPKFSLFHKGLLQGQKLLLQILLITQ